MRNITFILLGMALVFNACVDDFTDSNPPSKLDAPTFRVSATGDNQMFFTDPVNRFQNEYSGYVLYDDGPIEYTVSIIDAPGKIGAITVAASVPEFGTASLDDASVAAVQGLEEGSFKFFFTPNTDLPDRGERSLNLVVTVSDTQLDEDGEEDVKTTSTTIEITMLKCFTTGIDGLYVVTAASGNRDSIMTDTLGNYDYPFDGGNYDLQSLEDSAGIEEILVLIEEVKPGRFAINEVTGGVWPIYYPTRATPALDVHLCDNTITSHDDNTVAGSGSTARVFTVEGTVNVDGTIDITWSYVRANAAATPAYPAKGTYTLEKVE